MTHVEDHNLGVIRIDRVKDEIRVANGWEHTDARLVGKMTSLGKILKKAGDCLDAFNHSNCGCATMFVNIGKYLVDVRKRAFGPAHSHAL